MPVTYETWLVLLSIVMATQGAYVGLSLAVQIGEATGARRRLLLAGATVSLADELIRPSVIYTPAVRAAIAAAEVHAAAHITGGGFEGNIPRALPDGTRAVLERGSWEVPALFGEIRRLGRVSDEEMARVFNLGLGMVLVVGAASAGDALEALGTAGLAPVIVGRVEEGEPGVELVGPGFWPGTDGGPDQER